MRVRNQLYLNLRGIGNDLPSCSHVQAVLKFNNVRHLTDYELSPTLLQANTDRKLIYLLCSMFSWILPRLREMTHVSRTTPSPAPRQVIMCCQNRRSRLFQSTYDSPPWQKNETQMGRKVFNSITTVLSHLRHLPSPFVERTNRSGCP